MRVLRIVIDNHVIHVWPNAVLDVMVGTKVRLGQQIGSEAVKLPSNWSALSPFQRWHQVVPRIYPNRMAALGIWFERQMLHLEAGKVHLPVHLASLLATKFAAEWGLWWRLNPALDFFIEEAEACIFPAIRARTWDDLAGALKGDLRYDLRPGLPARACVKRCPHRNSDRNTAVAENDA
jgi:hypothetical protein